jgi:hypothetical protein
MDQPTNPPAGGTGAQNQPFTTNITLPEHPNTTFNERYFIELLAGSISLTIDEKKKIIEAVPKLSQHQIDELIKIFEEEKKKFAELAEKHADQINKLKAQHASEWEMYEMEQKKDQASQQDAQKAEEIRKKLGL